MQKLVSIIIPVFNKEKYIKNCLNSVLQQTYENIEIIIIDDGSTDNSYNICKSVIKGQKNVILKRKKNGGVSSARNMGLSLATGEKIIFVDADDRISEDFVSKVLEFYDFDLVSVGYKEIEDNNKTLLISCPKKVSINDQTKLYEYVFKEDIKFYTLVCMKLFDKKIIRDNKLSFDENISFGEDTLFMLQYISKCKTLKTINEALYFNIISTGTLSRSKKENIWDNLYYIYCLINAIYEKKYTDYLLVRYIKLALYFSQDNYDKFKKCIRDFSNVLPDININNCSKKDKIVFILLKLKMNKLLYYIYKKTV